MAGLSSQEELILLRKRARRRLVGAVVLVLLSTIVLWRVVGRVEELPMKPESVLVVGESASGTVSKVPGPSGQIESAPIVPVTASADKTALPESLASLSEPVAASSAQTQRAAAVSASAPHASTAKPKTKKPKVEPQTDGASPVVAKKHTQPAETHKQPDPAAILSGGADTTDSVTPSSATRSMIQLAAMSDPAKAEALRAKLSDLGVTARFSKVTTSKGEATRVRVGPFATRQEADAVLRKLAHAGVSGIIVSLPKP